MAEIRDIGAIATKWANVTPTRSADYQAGVESPRKDWARATTAANDAWKEGTQKAIAANSFSKGVAKAGTPAWQQGAISKGVARWGPGVALAQDKYAVAFAPYVQAIKNVVLPPRFARRDPRNLLRVAAIVKAMVDTKAAQLN